MATTKIRTDSQVFGSALTLGGNDASTGWGDVGIGSLTLNPNVANTLSPTLVIGNAAAQTANPINVIHAFGGVLVEGNLTVNGTTTTVQTEIVNQSETITNNLTVNGNSTLGNSANLALASVSVVSVFGQLTIQNGSFNAAAMTTTIQGNLTVKSQNGATTQFTVDQGTGNTNILTGTLTVGGTTTLSSTLAVTGTSTFTGLTTHNGGITVATAQAVTLSGTATLSVGGTSTFTGLATYNGGATVATGQALTLNGSASLTTNTGAVSFGSGAVSITNGTFAYSLTPVADLATTVFSSTVALTNLNKSGGTNAITSTHLVNNGTTKTISGDHVLINRTSTATGASSIINKSGNVLEITNDDSATTSGVINDTSVVLKVQQNPASSGALSSGDAVLITNNGTGFALETNGTKGDVKVGGNLTVTGTYSGGGVTQAQFAQYATFATEPTTVPYAGGTTGGWDSSTPGAGRVWTLSQSDDFGAASGLGNGVASTGAGTPTLGLGGQGSVNSFVPMRIYKNGILLRGGSSQDYTIAVTGNGSVQVTFVGAVHTGDRFVAMFTKLV